jgi:uncharacterized protein (TIGR02594 family)
MMLVFSAFRGALVALALLSAAIAASVSPASARSHHGAYRYAHTHYAYRQVRRQPAQPQYFAQQQPFAQPWYPQQVASYPRAVSRSRVTSYPQASSYPQATYRPQVAYRPRVERSVALTRLRKFADTQASVTPYEPGGGVAMSGSSSSLVMEARHYLGGNPTGRGSLWCARFMNLVLEKTGHHGTGSDMASSFASYGQRISGPQVGAIAVMGRRGGGHVGIITGIDSAGNPIMISGNNGNRVREAPVSRGRIYAYVMPN